MELVYSGTKMAINFGVWRNWWLLEYPLEIGHPPKLKCGDTFCLIDLHAPHDDLLQLVRNLRFDGVPI